MLSEIARQSGAVNLQSIQHQLRNTLSQIWGKPPRPRIGLAISGGVDSMALATLCHDIGAPKDTFRAFICDHGLRQESSDEAEAVVGELSRLNIMATVLKLDWTGHGDPKALANFEKIARILRYQALGRACYQNAIGNLLVAHHSDDQAETVLARIVDRKLGFGLSAMEKVRDIPNAWHVYGADGSGDTDDGIKGAYWQCVERGGVQVVRPLLSLKKQDLIGVCQAAGTKWFEDSTNNDRTLTLRNTVRYLHEDDLLPQALRAPRLLETASKIYSAKSEATVEAQNIFDAIPITLNLASGMVNFALDNEIVSRVRSSPFAVRAMVVRNLLLLIVPEYLLQLQDLDRSIEYLFDNKRQPSDFPKGQSPPPVMNGGAVIQELSPGSGAYHMGCAAPPRGRVNKLERELDGSWQLFSNRYWIRIRKRYTNKTYIATCLTPNWPATSRAKVDKSEVDTLLYLFRIPHSKYRGSLPMIVTENEDGEREIVGYPTCRVNGYREDEDAFEVRYKFVEMNGERHKIIGFDGAVLSQRSLRLFPRLREVL